MDDDKHTIHFAQYGSKLAQGMGELRASSQLQDVLIVCKGNAALHANSTILATCSDFFKNILVAQSARSSGRIYSIALPMTPRELLSPLLDLMHTGTARVAKNDKTQFLELARMLQVTMLLSDASQTPSSVQTEEK